MKMTRRVRSQITRVILLAGLALVFVLAGSPVSVLDGAPAKASDGGASKGGASKGSTMHRGASKGSAAPRGANFRRASQVPRARGPSRTTRTRRPFLVAAPESPAGGFPPLGFLPPLTASGFALDTPVFGALGPVLPAAAPRLRPRKRAGLPSNRSKAARGNGQGEEGERPPADEAPDGDDAPLPTGCAQHKNGITIWRGTCGE